MMMGNAAIQAAERARAESDRLEAERASLAAERSRLEEAPGDVVLAQHRAQRADLRGVQQAQLDAELAQRFGVKVDALRPWHYDNPFFQTGRRADSGRGLAERLHA